jgi:hypothetical protein
MQKGFVFRRMAAILPGLACAVFVFSAQGAPEESLINTGALFKNGAWEVGVSFSEPVSRDSAISLENYSIQGAEIEGLRYVERYQNVILRVTGLITNSAHTLSVTNLQSDDGTELPGASDTFVAKDFSWAQVGGTELGFPAEAVAVGDDGFDLISGGFQMREDYEESTFAFERITGDFDRKVRVMFQEGSSSEARAGLMAREVLDEGKGRPADPESTEDAFSRYVQLHVNPEKTAYNDGMGEPVPGAYQHQALARLFTGGINDPTFEGTTTQTITNTPSYPNAWLRIRRRGQSLTLFRGDDGTKWVQAAAFTFPAGDVRGPLSDTLHVGPNFTPETGNIPFSSNERRAFLAQFRDYGIAEGNEPTEPPTLRIIRSGSEVEISWDGGGILESSTTLAPESWTDVSSASSPYRTAPTQQHQFYRVRL